MLAMYSAFSKNLKAAKVAKAAKAAKTIEPRRFVLTLAAIPVTTGIDGVQRLRLALKTLLRTHGLRAVDVREIDTTASDGHTDSR